MKVTMTYREFFDRFYRDEDFAIAGINPWAMNEGLAQPEDTIELNQEQIKSLGLFGE